MATCKIDIFKNIWSHKTSQTFNHTSTYNLIGPAPFSIGTVAGKTASTWLPQQRRSGIAAPQLGEMNMAGALDGTTQLDVHFLLEKK